MSYLGNQPVKGEPVLAKYFIGDGTTLNFQLGFVPASTKSCSVTYNGIALIPESEYNCDSFGNIVFKTPPEENVPVYVRCDQVATYSSTTYFPDAFRQKQTQTVVVETDAITSISLSLLPNRNATDVYRNGLILDDGVDYFINNNIIQFYYALAQGDKIKVTWFE